MNDKYNVVQEWLYKHKLENKIRKLNLKIILEIRLESIGLQNLIKRMELEHRTEKKLLENMMAKKRM